MAFLFPLIGAVAGAAGGFAVGEMMRVGYEGSSFDVRFLTLMVGAIIGYFGGRMMVGKSKDNHHEA